MSDISVEEADLLAVALNKVCEATLHALKANDRQQRANVLTSVRHFRGQFEEKSEVHSFLRLLERWLDGQRPTSTQASYLVDPFRQALSTMLREVPPAAATPHPPPDNRQRNTTAPISRRVLTQLISAVVIASKSDNVALQQKLATQLINIQTQLSGRWKTRLGGLFENLRYVLGGADPHLLPRVADPDYQTLWQNTIQVLQQTEIDEGKAKPELLDRLVHNARFTIQSNKPELTTGFLQVLEDVQYQAQSSGSTTIVALIAAIRSYLQGLDPTPFTVLLEGQELDAWKRIIEVAR